MKTMKEPFFIIPNAEDVRITRLQHLPQEEGELALVAKTPRTCFGFKPNLDGSYHLIQCAFKRKVGILDHVPRCQNPLLASKSRSQVRTKERHPDFVSEIIETFCPPTGTVLDVFGGAMTTAISCVSSKHPCVVLEQDAYCFDLSIRRLEKLCRDRLLSHDPQATVLAEE